MKTNLVFKFYFFVALFNFSTCFGKDIIPVNSAFNDKNISHFIFVNQPPNNMHEASVLSNTFTDVNGPIDLSAILSDLGILNLLPTAKYMQLLRIVDNANTCLKKNGGDPTLIYKSITLIRNRMTPIFTQMAATIQIFKLNIIKGELLPILVPTLSVAITKQFISRIISDLNNILSSQQSQCLSNALQELEGIS